MQIANCIKCKSKPMVMPAGNCMCTRCKVSATSLAAWNSFMKVEDISLLVQKLERPIYVLKSVGVFSTDSGLKALAATTLKSLNELDFSQFFSDPKEAEKFKEKLEKLCQ